MTGAPLVLVVGAGPAGSVAALILARAGIRVRLMDRATFPRDKLCGDTLNPGAVAVLDRLGLGVPLRRHSRPLTGMTVTGPGGVEVSVDYPEELAGVAIVRRELDEILLEAAVAAGAEYVPAASVQAPLMDHEGRVAGVRLAGPRGATCTARMVIAADGRSSRLARALGLARVPAGPSRWAFGTYFTGIDALTTRGEMHIRGDGYVGIAPLGGGLANVCVVRARGQLRAGAASETVITHAVSDDARLRFRFGHAVSAAPATVLGPLAVDAVAAGCPGLLLAGDAAGFIDPMTGDGLCFALRGGELAARAALDELETGRPAHQTLQRTRHREFSAKWRFNRVLRGLVASSGGVRVAAAVAARWPLPFEALVRIAGDLHLARRDHQHEHRRALSA